MDVVYDMLTAVDKISHVTDLPLEKTGGIDLELHPDQGLRIKVKNLSYTYPLASKPSINGININIKGGEKLCISGLGSSGKTTLINAIAGMYTTFEGSVTIEDYSIRDLDIVHLRDRISKNVSSEDIFEGTILDNILVGRPTLREKDAINALEMADLLVDVNNLPNGLMTHILATGKGHSETFIQKLILARCLAKKPHLLILNDFFNSFPKHDRLELINNITNECSWTLMVVSNDPMIMSACDRVIYLRDGKVLADGSFSDVIQVEEVVKNLN